MDITLAARLWLIKWLFLSSSAMGERNEADGEKPPFPGMPILVLGDQKQMLPAFIAHRENQATFRFQLLQECRRHRLGRSGDDDAIERRLVRTARPTITSTKRMLR